MNSRTYKIVDPSQIHLFGPVLPVPRGKERDPLKQAIESAQQRYPDKVAHVQELNDFLTALKLSRTPMEHFLNMECVDDFMGAESQQPLGFETNIPSGDPDRWGAILKKLYQSCGPDAARTLWSQFSQELTQALEPLGRQFHLV